jgi:hypothetical protein
MSFEPNRINSGEIEVSPRLDSLQDEQIIQPPEPKLNQSQFEILTPRYQKGIQSYRLKNSLMINMSRSRIET